MNVLQHLYLVALGSNIRAPNHGHPAQVLHAACEALVDAGMEILVTSRVIRSAPMGPSSRRYANGAAVVSSAERPQEMLAKLKQIEREFGRGRRRGQRWQARVLDLDIILWSGGIVASPALQIPHPAFRQRRFVLDPASAIAGDWRDSVTNLSLRQLQARLTRPRPLTR